MGRIGYRLVKCDLNRPRSFYENLLDFRQKEFDKVKNFKNTAKRHNALIRLEYVEAQLRYYDKFQKEEV